MIKSLFALIIATFAITGIEFESGLEEIQIFF